MLVPLFDPLDFHHFCLTILFWVEFTIELTALIANAILIDQGARVIEDPNHRLPGVAQQMLDGTEYLHQGFGSPL